METQAPGKFVVAEMNTHHFMFRGAGRARESARAALLNAWRAARCWNVTPNGPAPFRTRAASKRTSGFITWNSKRMQAIATASAWCSNHRATIQPESPES
jgi:hypothetical protein